MRHYIWHKSQRIHGYSFNPIDGWVGRDMTDPASTDPEIVDLRNLYLSAEPDGDGCDGVIAYDCACPAVEPDCVCYHERAMDSYVDGGVLTPKLARPEYNVDGVAVAHQAQISKTADSAVVLKLVDAGAPNGYTVDVTDLFPDVSVVPGGKVTLTFTGGETQTVNLTAPSVGVRGGVLLDGTRFVVGGFYVVGS